MPSRRPRRARRRRRRSRRAAAQAKLAGLGAGTRAHLRARPPRNPAAAKHGKEWADHVPPTKENVTQPPRRAHTPAPGIPNRGAGAALKKAAASSKASHPPSSRAGPQGPSAADALDDSDAGLDLKDRLKKHALMATMKPNHNKVYVGDRAEVAGRKGSVMFVGPAEFAGAGSSSACVWTRSGRRRSATGSTTASVCSGASPGSGSSSPSRTSRKSTRSRTRTTCGTASPARPHRRAVTRGSPEKAAAGTPWTRSITSSGRRRRRRRFRRW